MRSLDLIVALSPAQGILQSENIIVYRTETTSRGPPQKFRCQKSDGYQRPRTLEHALNHDVIRVISGEIT